MITTTNPDGDKAESTDEPTWGSASDAENGFTVLDGAAFVAGAAVASVHVRAFLTGELFGPAWPIFWGTFAWVALTSTGPFLYGFRRFVRKLPGHPKVGDGLWATIGTPWLVTALIRSALAGTPCRANEWVSLVLSVGLAFTSIAAIIVIFVNWVLVPPDRASRTFSGPWTNRVGLLLAIAWPVQCGLGLVVSG